MKKQRKIVAIGGGEIKELETIEIDRLIVTLTGKKKPKALFIPTASNDAQGYCKTFSKVYGKILGCKTDNLLLSENPNFKEIERKILSADLIYVGGGNTLKMIKSWKKFKVDKVLKKAWNNGIVLSGVSAGAVCWFEKAFSDSKLKETGKYVSINCLGFLKGIVNPHNNNRKRKKAFQKFLKNSKLQGIPINDKEALVSII